MKFLNAITVIGMLLVSCLGVHVVPSNNGSTNQPIEPIVILYPAYCSQFGIFPAIAVPVQNPANDTVTGLVFGVFFNSIGQTVEVSTATITLASGQNLTAYVIINLPYGNYSVTVFAWSNSGQPISPEQYISATVPC